MERKVVEEYVKCCTIVFQEMANYDPYEYEANSLYCLVRQYQRYIVCNHCDVEYRKSSDGIVVLAEEALAKSVSKMNGRITLPAFPSPCEIRKQQLR
jgi:hypothetical protein